MEYINQLDHQFFLALNSFHTKSLDAFMLWVTHKYTWIPLYVFLIGSLIYRFKSKSWIVILALIAIVAISDRFTSGLMKPYFQRLRPCHDTTLSGQIVLIGNCGGEFGMASSHAANTFALATFLIFLLAKEWGWLWLLLPWSLIVSYSRIYLGVHFPGDVVTGMMVGFGIQFAVFYLIRKYVGRFLFDKT